ncbi:hypothetical protein [Sphingobacterium sp. UGAL515B_05]|uniref:hypothetical protein n=1 Tax=Sphingobacterium sp. UGAL515B_05 TaxID=2986767 RepID=UPI002954B0B3|nr:hypothetical protein [Sphingobacterium sp. UGAL515B_05]WON95078.1 hypothetical protein OK025_01375 [Sphingobacterium sp. UGAL515B_05]
MVDEKKLRDAILAIHDLIIRARLMAFEKVSNEVMFDFLDDLEYLPALILEDKRENTKRFEEYLESICNRYDYPGILIKYKNEDQL